MQDETNEWTITPDMARELWIYRCAGSGIPKIYQTLMIDAWVTDGHPGKNQAREFARDYIEMFEVFHKAGTGAVFCGSPGTGKTMLASIIANALLWKQHRIRFWGWIDLLERIKNTYRYDAEEKWSDILQELIGYDLLIIDEIGVNYDTANEKNLIYQIINKRYENIKPTIIVGNLTKAELQEYLGRPAMERVLNAGAGVVVFDWESARAKI